MNFEIHSKYLQPEETSMIKLLKCYYFSDPVIDINILFYNNIIILYNYYYVFVKNYQYLSFNKVYYIIYNVKIFV